MENRSDIEKRLGEKLEAAYMLEEIPQGMSREDFHRLIQAAEKKKKRRRNMLSLAAACVALCLVCGGFVAGMTLGESATAGNDGEKKTVQQGDSVVIGSGVGENDENVGVSTKTYTSIEDIPEDIRKEIHFLDSDEFELEKVKVVERGEIKDAVLYYSTQENQFMIKESIVGSMPLKKTVFSSSEEALVLQNTPIYISQNEEGETYMFEWENTVFGIICNESIDEKRIEVIIYDLMF